MTKQIAKMATANTETIPTPHTNGLVEDEYEEDKSKMRPADIDAVSNSIKMHLCVMIFIIFNISAFYFTWK